MIGAVGKTYNEGRADARRDAKVDFNQRRYSHHLYRVYLQGHRDEIETMRRRRRLAQLEFELVSSR